MWGVQLFFYIVEGQFIRFNFCYTYSLHSMCIVLCKLLQILSLKTQCFYATKNHLQSWIDTFPIHKEWFKTRKISQHYHLLFRKLYISWMFILVYRTKMYLYCFYLYNEIIVYTAWTYYTLSDYVCFQI